MGLTPWEVILERRKANIGFISKGKAFRDPTPVEMACALQFEIDSWQETKGKVAYKMGYPYSVSKAEDDNFRKLILGPRRDRAIEAYINTPMDKDGILAERGINIEPYKWREVGIIKAFIYWICGQKVRRKND